VTNFNKDAYHVVHQALHDHIEKLFRDIVSRTGKDYLFKAQTFL